MEKGKCQICEQQDYLVEHHIQSRSKNGSNKKSNKTDICSSCHVKVHKGDIVVEGIFLTSLGYKLIWRYKTEQPITGEQPEVYIIK
jgi:hypothetical protein